MQHAEDTGRRGQKVANWVLDHRLITILFVLVPSLILAYALPSIEVYSRFADLLPAKHTYIKNYNRMKQTFGGANVVTMSLEVVGDGDIFTVETLNKIKLVTEEVDVIQGVNHYQVASIAHPKIRRIRTTSGGLIKSEPVLPRIIPGKRSHRLQCREKVVLRSPKNIKVQNFSQNAPADRRRSGAARPAPHAKARGGFAPGALYPPPRQCRAFDAVRRGRNSCTSDCQAPYTHRGPHLRNCRSSPE